MPQTDNPENQAQASPGSMQREEPSAEDVQHPGITPTSHIGGQGAVRRKEDGRLQDNLTSEQRSEIGRKGGHAVSSNREHMAQIGRKGGLVVSSNREHMSQIGQKGGRS